MSDIALCCASACPLLAVCKRNEVHHEGRGFANYGGYVRLDVEGNYDCDYLVPFVMDEQEDW